jgi:ribosomal protein S27AE
MDTGLGARLGHATLQPLFAIASGEESFRRLTMEIETRTTLHLLHDDSRPAGTAERRSIPKSERRKKAFRSFLPFGGLALMCIPIPLLHFILVPLFVGLGAVKSWSYLSAKGVITRGEVACPRCSEKVYFANVPENWPLKLLCEKCGYPLRMYLAAEG